ncbi:hypothetical protein E2C01_053692 [Portunus trituberculatus]|uniref:Uncharacterized protein n=1 Tax=Portunus trituberculatus TaxID=210409 RepID=A0A5B7GR60_PORTR|nr:hypothetical protein [Portunus trituberculatus]
MNRSTFAVSTSPHGTAGCLEYCPAGPKYRLYGISCSRKHSRCREEFGKPCRPWHPTLVSFWRDQ